MTTSRSNIGLNSVCQGVHASMRCELLRHGQRNICIQNCNIRGNFKISQRIFNISLIISDNGKGCNLCCCAARGRNSYENCFIAQRGNRERVLDILKGFLRMLIEDPHRLSRINRRAAADSHNYIRLEGAHGFCTTKNSFNRRIRLNTFKKLRLHANVMQYIFHLL